MCESGSFPPCLPFFLSLPSIPTMSKPLPSSGWTTDDEERQGGALEQQLQKRSRGLCLQGTCLGTGPCLSRAGGLGLLGS